MKPDLQLQRDVAEELRWDPSINEKEIAIAVKDGVVTLRGTVRSYTEKFAAELAAERVNGVRAVAEELTVQLPGEHVRDDTDIAHAVVTALNWDIQVPKNAVTATVEKGLVTLRGDVDWQFQKEAAAAAVRHLVGVKGVSNFIRLAPALSTFDVKTKIESALKRSAEVEADRITVETTDGKVTLKGSVRSWSERRDAERAAWQAPGVREVDDRLVITV